MTGEKTAIPRVPFGAGGPDVTIVGLGGEGVLRTWGRGGEARGVIERALEQGITYCDSARVYSGSEGYYGSVWSQDPSARAGVFQTSKSAARDRLGARRDLESTLRTLGTERLDLWQIHDVRTTDDLERIGGRGGALEAFLAAREEGLTRFIGVTGHHDPAVLARAVERWPVDAVLMPVNPVEGVIGGFLDRVLPLALDRGLAVIGMKIFGAGHYIAPGAGVGAADLVRYALSVGVTVAIAGCSTPEEVGALADAGRRFTAMSPSEEERLLRIFRPRARQLAYYRGVV